MRDLNKLTIKDLRDLGPCYDPSRYLSEDWSGTLLEILSMEQVSAVDRIWVARKVLSDKELRLFACDCARRALVYGKWSDPRSIKAIEVSEAYATGKATAEELKEAKVAADAAYAAAYTAAAYTAAADAAYAAAAYAAYSAAYTAAVAAAYAAAAAAAYAAAAYAADAYTERSKQLDYLKSLFKD